MILAHLWMIDLQGVVILQLLPFAHTFSVLLCPVLTTMPCTAQAPCHLNASRGPSVEDIGKRLRSEGGVVCCIYTTQSLYTFPHIYQCLYSTKDMAAPLLWDQLFGMRLLQGWS